MTWNIYSAPQLEFEVVGAGGTESYIAVDDIVLSAHPCQAEGSYHFQKSLFREELCDFSESLELIWYRLIHSDAKII